MSLNRHIFFAFLRAHRIVRNMASNDAHSIRHNARMRIFLDGVIVSDATCDRAMDDVNRWHHIIIAAPQHRALSLATATPVISHISFLSPSPHHKYHRRLIITAPHRLNCGVATGVIRRGVTAASSTSSTSATANRTIGRVASSVVSDGVVRHQSVGGDVFGVVF